MTGVQRLAWFEAQAEAACAKMYDASKQDRCGGTLQRPQEGVA
jgi:hypothetical protein